MYIRPEFVTSGRCPDQSLKRGTMSSIDKLETPVLLIHYRNWWFAFYAFAVAWIVAAGVVFLWQPSEDIALALFAAVFMSAVGTTVFMGIALAATLMFRILPMRIELKKRGIIRTK